MVEPSTQALARKGVVALGLRQVVGMVIRTPLLVIMVRLLGPSGYGQYASATTLIGFLLGLSGLGTEIYLIRTSEQPTVEAEERIFSTLLLSSAVVSGVGFIGSFVVLTDTNRSYIEVFRLALLTLPLNILWIPSMARLERSMRFRALGLIELVGDIVFFAIALPLIYWTNLGTAGAVAGLAGQQAWLLIATCSVSRFVPRLRRPNIETRTAISFGFPFVFSAWVLQLRELANPLIVGHYRGEADVGRVALAQRLTTTVLFTRQSTARVAAVALARVQHDVVELQRAHTVGTQLQTAVASASLGGFALLSTWVIPTAFGAEWESTSRVFSLIAAGLIVQTLFGLHASVLHFLGQGMKLLRIRLVQSAVALGLALLLVPRFGIIGLGIAELGRSATFFLIHRATRSHFQPSYRAAGAWVVSAGPWLCLPFLLTQWMQWVAITAGAMMFLVVGMQQFKSISGIVRLAPSQREPLSVEAVT
jgi:O-antigen/teichoic acid export membrane protein